MDVQQLRLFSDEASVSTRAVGPAPMSDAARDLGGRLPKGVRLGTSSWSFPGWDGLVYDRPASQNVLAREGLTAYAAHPLFRTVGVDRTYYRPMTTDAFRAYAAAVPDDFRFVVKADRQLTSPIDPDVTGVRVRNSRFLDHAYAEDQVIGPMVEGMGEKAGVLIFQFPPVPPSLVGGRKGFYQGLQRFLTALPRGPLYAVELRTPAFLTEDYAGILLTTGAAHCFNIHPSMSPLSRQLAVVQSFYQPALVVRWMLHSGLQYEAAKERYQPFDRIVDEDVASRERVATTVLDVLLAERPTYVIANN
jgi:uncharacterized protein YecE (DUF72 family)